MVTSAVPRQIKPVKTTPVKVMNRGSQEYGVSLTLGLTLVPEKTHCVGLIPHWSCKEAVTEQMGPVKIHWSAVPS